MNDTASEIIIELLNALRNGAFSSYGKIRYDEINRSAEDFLYANGYRRDGLTGESWIKE